jgi:hypothetical protein
MFIKKIKLIFLNKNCNFLKKIVMQGNKFFTHRLGGTKVHQKEKKKWGLSFKKIIDDVISRR